MKDKVYLITGGTSGIGRATAEALGQRGASVVVSGRREDEGQRTVNLVEKAGGRAKFIRCDVSISTEVERLVNGTLDAFGRLDGAFNNSGVAGPSALLHETSDADFDEVIGINLKGVWLCMKHEIAALLKAGHGGAIVNTASIGGVVAVLKTSVYDATKHAVIGLTKAAALEYGKQGIRVNAVAPAAIKTDLLNEMAGTNEETLAAAHPIGRIGQPSEVADAVVYLLSDQASFVTGHTLLVDGGYTAQ